MRTHSSIRHIFLIELKIRQKLGFIEKGTLLLTVEDPKPNIGSGSATLNALLCVAERLAARGNQTVSYARIIGSCGLCMC